MPKCQGCGHESARILTTFSKDGTACKDICPKCDPMYFEGAKQDGSDKKLWMGPDAYPNRYKMGPDGILHATDELISDTWESFSKKPNQEQLDKKKKIRTTTPLTDAEIRELNATVGQWLNENYIKPQQAQ